MLTESKIKDIKFVTDDAGHKTAVIMPIERYEEYLEMLEDLHLVRVYHERKDDERRPLSEFLEEMRGR
jgi:hypothetical protein